MGAVNLADWAASVGVNRHTAYRWFREGALPVPAERVGRLILVRTTPAGDAAAGGVVIYARVSSHDQRADLDRQVARLRVRDGLLRDANNYERQEQASQRILSS
ncbi:hypothetical protein MSHI_41100 [Mycobacterium shinjukuense]|uniref:Resolvase/invertase-type recombinase catalytic domain-containing protein n=1 Tax=Mycobacterium shinjukuense TaxID=398694 RepID=A0A7I7MVA3_9MYCO|nr:hypothetical protein MSHI_00120 [Mycobacterium shinjukuense]BBX76204.1 hypothetical protein MSHI_41100 [Mycobacterium shinjukuense]